MENYKIKVNNGAESKEAQELFKEVNGCIDSNDRFGIVCLVDGRIYTDRVELFESYDDCKEINLHQLRDLVAKSKPTEQALISGADAKLAWAKGENVQISHKHATLKKEWHDLYGTLMLSAFDSDMYEFRLKPRTIKLELEIPAPFEPKEGEKAYRLAPAIPCGYTEFYLEEDEYEHQFGAWRTEEEIKQVVAALRGALKNG